MLEYPNISSYLHQLQQRNQVTGDLCGIIREATRPIKNTRTEDQYIVRVKLIDESLFEQSNKTKFKECTVYLFNRSASKLNFFKIGDILLLRRFNFGIWQETIFESRASKNGCFYLVDRAESNQVKLTDSHDQFGIEFQMGRIFELKNWEIHHMYKNLRLKVGIELLDQISLKLDEFNIVLAIKEIKQINLQQSHYILFDKMRNLFMLKFSPSVQFQIGDNVFITGIKYISQQFEIILTATGNMMVLPYHMLEDYSLRAVYKDSFRGKKLQETTGFLTTIKKGSFVEKELQQRTYLQQLTEMVKYYTTELKQKFQNRKKHRVEVYVVSARGTIRLLYQEYNYYVNKKFLEERFKVVDENQKIKYLDCVGVKYIYQVIFEVRDVSLEGTDMTFEIALFSWDDNTKHFFPDIELQELNVLLKRYHQNELEIREKQIEVQEKLRGWFEYLQKVSSQSKQLELILEPLLSESHLKYRIVDSQLKNKCW